jgi:hypothetical protein
MFKPAAVCHLIVSSADLGSEGLVNMPNALVALHVSEPSVVRLQEPPLALFWLWANKSIAFFFLATVLLTVTCPKT